MARIFTISFTYNEARFSTLVIAQTSPLYMEYILFNLAPDLVPLLPGNKIISPSANSFFFPNVSSQHSTVLMNSIIKAIDGHLQVVKN